VTAVDTIEMIGAFKLRLLCSPFLTLCLSARFLPGYFGLRSEPIIEVVTVFIAPFLVKLIRAYPN
jgi:hypothetical protein